MEDEDFFSDDDFADIPDDAIQAIEQHALVSTQTARAPSLAPIAANPWPSSNTKKRPHNATSLNRPGGSNLPWRPPQPGAHFPRGSQFARQSSNPGSQYVFVPSQMHHVEEEEVIDLNEPSITVPAHVPAASYRQPNAMRGRQRDYTDADTEAAFAAADAELEDQPYGTLPHRLKTPTGSSDISALQARIAALEANQERLQRAEQEARALAQAKQGEIQIVRAKLDTSAKTFENQLAALQQQHREEVSRQKAELEAGRREREQMETDHRFLQHDLAREAERLKRLDGHAKARSVVAAPNGRTETPKKLKRIIRGMGDGFDDAEIRMASPSRSRDRSADQTPKAGLKRKRTAADSPVPIALGHGTQLRSAPAHEDSAPLTTSFDTTAVADDGSQVDEKFEYFRMLLNHRPYEGHERTLEAFAKVPLPSRPETTFGAAFTDAIAIHDSPDVEDYARLVATTLLDFWSICLKEKQFRPFYMILAMLRHVLTGQRASVTCGLLTKAIPLCVALIDLIAVDTARESLYGATTISINDENEKHSRIEDVDELEADEVVEFLGYLCDTAALDPEHCLVFWRHMELHFIMILLQPSQPIFYITTMLRMLRTSALDASFAMISGCTGTADDSDAPQQQRADENMLIGRLTTLLFEPLVPPAAEPPYSQLEETELRREILEVLVRLCAAGDHGGRLLVQHRSVIGRLVRFLDAQVSALYTFPPLSLPSAAAVDDRSHRPRNEDSDATYNAVAATVNTTTRLLYFLLRTYDSTLR